MVSCQPAPLLAFTGMADWVQDKLQAIAGQTYTYGSSEHGQLTDLNTSDDVGASSYNQVTNVAREAGVLVRTDFAILNEVSAKIASGMIRGEEVELRGAGDAVSTG